MQYYYGKVTRTNLIKQKGSAIATALLAEIKSNLRWDGATLYGLYAV